MDLIVKSRNGKVSERQRQHIEEKLGKLARYLDQISSATVEISAEQRHSKAEVQRVQVTLVAEHGLLFRADERANDLYAAIDEVQSILQRQITRYKEKHWRRGKLRRQSGKIIEEVVATPDVAGTEEAAEREPQILRTKEFILKPMYTDEAIEQMELLSHGFFLFRDADSMKVSVVYRRKDGNYGLIVPEG